MYLIVCCSQLALRTLCPAPSQRRAACSNARSALSTRRPLSRTRLIVLRLLLRRLFINGTCRPPTTVNWQARRRPRLLSRQQPLLRLTNRQYSLRRRYYDRGVSEQSFQVGQLVWLYWPNPPVRQKFRKLQQVWIGQWRILEFRTDVVVIIQHTQKQQNKRFTSSVSL